MFHNQSMCCTFLSSTSRVFLGSTLWLWQRPQAGVFLCHICISVVIQLSSGFRLPRTIFRCSCQSRTYRTFKFGSPALHPEVSAKGEEPEPGTLAWVGIMGNTWVPKKKLLQQQRCNVVGLKLDYDQLMINNSFAFFSQGGMTIKNMSLKVGQTMTIVGVPNPDASE